MSTVTPFETSKKPERIGSIDAVRGTAMLFVCLAHFTSVYLLNAAGGEVANYLSFVSKIASPTFVVVSGMVVGVLVTTHPSEFHDLRFKLFDRGLFLLVLGHAILSVTVAASLSDFPRAYRMSFITDAIAIAIIVGPSLVAELNGSSRLSIAAAVFCLDWFAVAQWHPAGAGLGLVKRFFVGSIPNQTGAIDWPFFAVIPWLTVYLAATTLGERVGRMYAANDRRGADRLLARVGGLAFCAGALIHAATMILRRIDPSIISLDPSLLTFFSIYQKFPPGPVYLAFFGGAGLLLMAAILEIERRRKIPALMARLRQFGRASLFTFIAQYAVYVRSIGRLHLRYTPLWPVMFLGTLVLLAQGAALWDSFDGNRFLTVGLFPLIQDQRHRGYSGQMPDRRTQPVAIQAIIGEIMPALYSVRNLVRTRIW